MLNNDRVRQIFYIVVTVAGLAIPVLVAAQAAIESGATPLEVIIAILGAVATVGGGTAAVKLNGQIKSGVLAPENAVRAVEVAQQKLTVAATQIERIQENAANVAPPNQH